MDSIDKSHPETNKNFRKNNGMGNEKKDTKKTKETYILAHPNGQIEAVEECR